VARTHTHTGTRTRTPRGANVACDWLTWLSSVLRTEAYKFVAPPVAILLGSRLDSSRSCHAWQFSGGFGGFSGGFPGGGSYVYSTVHLPTRSHVNFMQFVMFYVEGLWCYAWESQNDRLQFIQFILLSQTFVSASVPHFPSLSLFPSHVARMCVLLTNWWNNFRSV